MTEHVWLRSHVERCLEDIWEEYPIQADDDGDYLYRTQTAACWVHIDTSSEPATVHAFAQAALQIPGSAKLLREVNELNHAARFATIFWADEAVMVKDTILATSVDRASLDQLCGGVASVADDIGCLIASVYGGSTPFSPQTEAADGEAA